MNKTEVMEVVQAVNSFFPGKLKMDDPKALVVAWHRLLKDYEFNYVIDNLNAYAANSRFVPAIADLIKPPKVEVERYIPTTEETRAYLEEQERVRQQVLNDPKVQEARTKAQEEIRRILGIRG